MAVLKESHHTSQLLSLDRKIKKLVGIWDKFKKTPSSISFLAKDLTLLITTISTVIQHSQSTRFPPYVAITIHKCLEALRLLLDASAKHTGKFGRKPMNANNLNQLELQFTDIKIRLLLIQFSIERLVEEHWYGSFISSHKHRRESSSPTSSTFSHPAVAEELAQLHLRTIPSLSFERAKFDDIEPKTDSLLSFRCYSELVGREKLLLQLDSEFEVSDVVVLAGPGGVGYVFG